MRDGNRYESKPAKEYGFGSKHPIKTQKKKNKPAAKRRAERRADNQYEQVKRPVK